MQFTALGLDWITESLHWQIISQQVKGLYSACNTVLLSVWSNVLDTYTMVKIPLCVSVFEVMILIDTEVSVEFEAIRTAANLCQKCSPQFWVQPAPLLSASRTHWNVNLRWNTYGGVFRAGCYDVFKEGIPLDIQHFSLMATNFRVVRVQPARLKWWELQISICSSVSAGHTSKVMHAR